MASLLGNAVISGTFASVVSGAVLATLAKAEGKDAVQPLNATSHWLQGELSGQVTEVDAAHTGLGVATHHGACMFWATVFETFRDASPTDSVGGIVRDAVAVSAIAAAVDYGLVPKKLTPGWEEVLPARSIAGGFAGLALGLALGGMVTAKLR